MLDIVQFVNGKYGLQNTMTGIVVDGEWRTIWGAHRARRKRQKNLLKAMTRLNKREGKV